VNSSSAGNIGRSVLSDPMRQAVGGPERPWRLSPQSMEQAKRQHGALWAMPRSPEKVGAVTRWETIPAQR
jgi:hypothetical protein